MIDGKAERNDPARPAIGLALGAALVACGCGGIGDAPVCPAGTHEQGGACVSDLLSDAAGAGADGPAARADGPAVAPDAGEPDMMGGSGADAGPDAGCEGGGFVGAACGENCDCGSGPPGWECLDTPPGGYCTHGCVPGSDPCPEGSACLGERCYDMCATEADCRADEGYECIAKGDVQICWAAGGG